MIGGLVRLTAVGGLAWAAGFAWFGATLPDAAPLSLATDGVVVLTGGPGRLLRGIEVLDARSAQRLLVSGAGRGVTAAALAETLPATARAVNRTLFANRVDLGYAAVDTRSNAEETAQWTADHGFRSLRLVTSAGHMRRAALELEAQLPPGVTVLPDAVPVEPQAGGLAREYSKFLVRWAAIRLNRWQR